MQDWWCKPKYNGPPAHFVLQLVDLLLEKNYFRYEDFYLQIKGVSMDSSFAPRLANLFMACMEDEFILNKHINPFRPNITMFWRFTDNCLCIFTDNTKTQDFLEWLNNIHSSIKFTMEGVQNERAPPAVPGWATFYCAVARYSEKCRTPVYSCIDGEIL